MSMVEHKIGQCILLLHCYNETLKGKTETFLAAIE